MLAHQLSLVNFKKFLLGNVERRVAASQQPKAANDANCYIFNLDQIETRIRHNYDRKTLKNSAIRRRLYLSVYL